jgi:hypothetical protein
VVHGIHILASLFVSCSGRSPLPVPLRRLAGLPLAGGGGRATRGGGTGAVCSAPRAPPTLAVSTAARVLTCAECRNLFDVEKIHGAAAALARDCCVFDVEHRESLGRCSCGAHLQLLRHGHQLLQSRCDGIHCHPPVPVGISAQRMVKRGDSALQGQCLAHVPWMCGLRQFQLTRPSSRELRFRDLHTKPRDEMNLLFWRGPDAVFPVDAGALAGFLHLLS